MSKKVFLSQAELERLGGEQGAEAILQAESEARAGIDKDNQQIDAAVQRSRNKYLARQTINKIHNDVQRQFLKANPWFPTPGNLSHER